MSLTAEALTIGYEGRTVIDGLDLEIPEGKVTAILGPNGCGKSTLLRALARLLSPSEGSVLLDGEDVTKANPDKLRRRIGYVIQQVGLFPHQKVVDKGWYVGLPPLIKANVKWGGPLDLTHPEVQTFWKGQIKKMTDRGIEGWKLDFAEDVHVGLAGLRFHYTFADGSDERRPWPSATASPPKAAGAWRFAPAMAPRP